jgi:hypothetical protein
VESGIQNGRFALRVGTSNTALTDVEGSDKVKVQGNAQAIYVIASASDPIRQVTVYDFQGRKVFESNSGAGYYPLQRDFMNSPLIVKVTTKNQVESVKLNIIKN